MIEEEYPSVVVSTSIDDDLVIMADGLISQLIVNLLSNAVNHNNLEGLEITLIGRESGDTIEVIVSDNGRGIPAEVRETCFELGKHGPDSDGDGIGLYLVSRLANLYGGSVSLSESPEGGAEFTIELPSSSPLEYKADA